MRIDYKTLKKLSVETQSGTKLGTIYDLVLEIDGQIIVQYLVRHSLVSQQSYLVSRDQVVSINNKKIIVDDGVLKLGQKLLAKEKAVVNTGAVAMTSEKL